jgi:D-alanyl-D-alanine dipeptidase
MITPSIPPLSEPQNWPRLPIVECGEPLVPLLESERLRTRSLYAEMKIPEAPTVISVRSGVRDRLIKAANTLPEGVVLTVFDGYRPLAVQQWLWDDFSAQVRVKNPGFTEAEIEAEVRQFVAFPQANPLAPPPHRTGGAVDVYLVYSSTGEQLPMGTEADEGVSASQTRWFEENPEEPFTTNRRLLFHAMIEAGFTNYLGEWWHFDYGNQRWANVSRMDFAIYGAASDPAHP